LISFIVGGVIGDHLHGIDVSRPVEVSRFANLEQPVMAP
jgi:hypothetical protein